MGLKQWDSQEYNKYNTFTLQKCSQHYATIKYLKHLTDTAHASSVIPTCKWTAADARVCSSPSEWKKSKKG